MPAFEDRRFEEFARAGDLDALTDVFDRTAPMLYGLARHLGAGGDADDLVQTTFVTAIERARSYDPARPVQPWLLGILVRHLRRSQRRAGRHLDHARIAVPPAEDPAAHAQHRELRDRVATAVASVPGAWREVLQLRLDGVPPREIALRLGRPGGTVRCQLDRALRWVRARVPAAGAVALVPAVDLAPVRAAVLDTARRAAPAGTLLAGISWGAVAMKYRLAAVAALVFGLTVAAATWTPYVPAPQLAPPAAGSMVAAAPRASEPQRSPRAVVQGASARPKTPAPPRAGLLSGTVVVRDPAQRGFHAEDGRLEVALWSGSVGMHSEVDVVGGSWQLDTEGAGAWSVEKLVLGGRAVLVDRAFRGSMPVAAEPVALGGIWMPPQHLNVVDARSGERLDRIAVVRDGFDVPWFEPQESLPGEAVVEGARSPVAWTPEVHPGTRAFRVHVPGYAWQRVNLDLEQQGERTVRMEREARLSVTLTGTAPPPGAELRLRHEGWDTPALECAVSERPALAWRRLPPGSYVAAVEVGSAWGGGVEVLGRTLVELRAGEHAEVELELAAPRPPLPRALVHGSLRIAPGWGAVHDLVLRLSPETALAQRGAESVSLPLAKMESVAPRHWRFQHDALPCGRYVAELVRQPVVMAPALLRQPVVLDRAGSPIEVRCAAPAEVSVVARDADTGADLPLRSASWYQEVDLNISGAVFPAEAEIAAGGSARLRTAPGELVVSLETRDGRSSGLQQAVTAGTREIVVPIHRTCGADVEIVHGEEVLPWDEEWELNLAEWGPGSSIERNRVRLGAPGRARVRLRAFGWQQVGDGAVEVPAGEIVRLRIPVQRARR